MTDFILVPSRVPEALERMTDVDAFRASASFNDLTPEERSIPGVVTASFTQFALNSGTPSEVALQLLQVLEDLAALEDLDVDNLLMVDAIEMIDPADLERMRPQFGAALNRLVADSEARWAGA